MKKSWMILLAALLPLGGLTAQDSFQQAVGSAEQDLAEATSELARLRAQVAEERLPLARRLNLLEDEKIEIERESERVSQLADSRTSIMKRLEDEIGGLRDENNFISSVLEQYVRDFPARVHISEVQRYRGVVDPAVDLMGEPGAAREDVYAAQLKVIEASLARLREIVGGVRFSGKAILPDSRLVDGNFALSGPLGYFASNDGTVAGLAMLQPNSAEAAVVDIGLVDVTGIISLAETGSGVVPVDSSLGNALRIASTQETTLEHIAKGGVVMYPILGIAAAAFLIALYKLVELASVPRVKESDLQSILKLVQEGNFDEAKNQVAKLKGPMGSMLRDAIENADADQELLEEILYEHMLATQPKLERLLPFIQVTAATAPLLGLLGTVTGMINTFKLITIFGTGDARSLSSGISEALITTEFGLIIAIPTLIAHALLSRYAKSILGGMEKVAIAFINGLPDKKA